jgi:hypothetical protein
MLTSSYISSDWLCSNTRTAGQYSIHGHARRCRRIVHRSLTQHKSWTSDTQILWHRKLSSPRTSRYCVVDRGATMVKLCITPAATDDASMQPTEATGSGMENITPVHSQVAPTAAVEGAAASVCDSAPVAAGNGTVDTTPQGAAGQLASAAITGNEAEQQPTAAHTAPNQSAADGGVVTETQPLSKNQQKKLRKMQR